VWQETAGSPNSRHRTAETQEQFANQKAGPSCSKNNEVPAPLPPQISGKWQDLSFPKFPTSYCSSQSNRVKELRKAKELEDIQQHPLAM